MSGLTLTPLTLSASSEAWGPITAQSVQSGKALGLWTQPYQIQASQTSVSLGAAMINTGFSAEATVVGTSQAGAISRYEGISVTVKDATSAANWSISGAANNGSGLIRITATGHGVNTGDSVGVYSVGGTTEANGQWIVTKIDADHVDLQGSTFTHTYTSGGVLTNRGVMYGALLNVQPTVFRDGGLTGTAANGDDVNGIGVFNGGTTYATAAFLVNRNAAFGSSHEFYQAIEIEANADTGLRMIAAYNWGIDLWGGGTATYATGVLRLPSGGVTYGRKSDNSTDLPLFRIRSDTNEFELMGASRFSGAVAVTDGVSFNLGTASGTQIGQATTQKLGFWGATPAVQQSAAGNTHTVTAGSTTSVFTNTTFDGSTGSTAYTVGDIVKALKIIGLLAP